MKARAAENRASLNQAGADTIGRKEAISGDSRPFQHTAIRQRDANLAVSICLLISLVD